VPRPSFPARVLEALAPAPPATLAGAPSARGLEIGLWAGGVAGPGGAGELATGAGRYGRDVFERGQRWTGALLHGQRAPPAGFAADARAGAPSASAGARTGSGSPGRPPRDSRVPAVPPSGASGGAAQSTTCGSGSAPSAAVLPAAAGPRCALWRPLARPPSQLRSSIVLALPLPPG
jgi:hypothetical protein